MISEEHMMLDQAVSNHRKRIDASFNQVAANLASDDPGGPNHPEDLRNVLATARWIDSDMLRRMSPAEAVEAAALSSWARRRIGFFSLAILIQDWQHAIEEQELREFADRVTAAAIPSAPVRSARRRL
ncbi:TPA: hypothetical protein QDB15_000052 [Burkholderia vietnamiensis]|uniref:Uncharacterized protein n=1 Tax=Pandoraea apista TaxID=93218 RepID=A0A5E5P2J8_9BURK|nr:MULTISPECIES: hypothetical protein [Burkholderiaceae]MCA8206326.1 hypothetical protein [Burkholderia vietnamiensis]VVG70403.1 hypothetical protein PAP18089_01363 [Pandoraea apista]HDR8943124.1 hypothetical protein [Burkholderia vietnamiensis]HDR9116328.1 hypothetical protein [Burkholderia vietnamiensis]HDR9205374.1 hypothetical protein [Burkholderia vietnamiensis]